MDGICVFVFFTVLFVSSSRGSVDRDRKTVNDAAVETYDNVPSDGDFTASQNGFISIITSKLCFVVYVIYALHVFF